MTVFDINNKSDHTRALAFLDPNGALAIQRYDTMKYRQLDKLCEKATGFFWQPTEIELTRDSKDFKSLSAAEQHVFTKTLSRQILLDSVQGRSPSLAFLPLVTIPELEAWITTWSFFETIHSRSYTHIIRNVYADPSIVFDAMLDIEPIVDCARDISKHYDELIRLGGYYQLLGYGEHTVNDSVISVTPYNLKRALWLALMSVNILEGVRFYSSFCVAFSYSERKLMESNAKIIKLICRDENIHLASTQALLKLLPKDDPDFIQIALDTRDECIGLFEAAVDQEKQWNDYLFSEGSMLGLNAALLNEYVEWTANKRMLSVGLPSSYRTSTNPLPWMQKWIAGAEVQNMPQEVSITSYTTGDMNKDLTDDTFKGFSL